MGDVDPLVDAKVGRHAGVVSSADAVSTGSNPHVGLLDGCTKYNYAISVVKPGPRWKLDEVRTIAAERNGLLLKKTRAKDSFATPAEAYREARRVLADLTLDNYADTVKQQFDEEFDIYGVVLGGNGWMLKFTIDESQPQVVVISLHPLERPLKCAKGTLQLNGEVK